MTLEQASYWAAIFAALAAFLTWRNSRRQFSMQKRDENYRAREISSRLRSYSALFLDPAKFVGAYAVKAKGYMPVSG